MPHGYGHNPAKEIQILVTLHVPQVLHAGVVGHQRFRVVSRNGREEILLVLLEDLIFGHSALRGFATGDCNASRIVGSRKRNTFETQRDGGSGGSNSPDRVIEPRAPLRRRQEKTQYFTAFSVIARVPLFAA
jgi:hypothetical protein